MNANPIPRLRGYQFRTEPGTKPVKRNKPAYQPLKTGEAGVEGAVEEAEEDVDVAANTAVLEELVIDESVDANVLVEKGFAERESDVLAHKEEEGKKKEEEKGEGEKKEQEGK